MARMSGLFLLCLLGFAESAASPQASKEAVVSAEALLLFAYKTKDLAIDFLTYGTTSAYKAVSPHVDPLEKQFWVQYDEVQKLFKKHAKPHVDPVISVASDTYATASTTATPIFLQVKDLLMNTKEKLTMQVNAIVDVGVENFEKAHPARRGAIPKDPNSRALLLVWLMLCAYVALRVLKIALRVVRYFVCCGFCAKRNKNATPKASAKGAANSKAPAQQQPKKKGK